MTRRLRARVVMTAIAGGIVAAALGSAGCQKVQAKSPGPEPVSLDLPEPPQRLLIPVTIEPPPPPPVTTDKPAATPAPPTRPRPAPTPTPVPPAGASQPPESTPVVVAGEKAVHEARAYEKLKSAETNIAKLSRNSLGPDAQKQFDSAKRFITLTREALTAKNYTRAAYCADKAATLAALLVKGEEQP